MTSDLIVDKSIEYRMFNERFAEALRPFDITVMEWGIIGIIHKRKEVSVTELAMALGTSLGYVSKASSDLIKKGILEFYTSPQDGRRKTISIVDHEKVKRIERVVRRSVK